MFNLLHSAVRWNRASVLMIKGTDKIGFGGGCHWCTEAVFMSLAGVTEVQQGFIQSEPPHDSFSEAVMLSYNADIIDLTILIEVHLRTHASTSQHKMRGKYRSAVYTFGEDQENSCIAILEALQLDFDQPLVTQVLPFVKFKASQEKFQRYYYSDPARPFCTRYIDPKLDMLRTQFADKLHTEE